MNTTNRLGLNPRWIALGALAAGAFTCALTRMLPAKADTVPVTQEEVPVVVTTNVINGVAQASALISVPVDLVTPTSTLTLTRTNGHYKAHRSSRGPVRNATAENPPMPVQVDPAVHADSHTVWNDYPPEFVVVPRDVLPDGARRQWSTTTQSNYTYVIYEGKTNRVPLKTIVSTNHHMRIVKPMLEISAEVPAVSTNVTNF